MNILDVDWSRLAPNEFVNAAKERIEHELRRILQRADRWPGNRAVQEAMEYAVFAGGGGKRIRPALTLMTARCFDTDLTTTVSAAAAIELIHSYTLVIDDIQDKDDIRRNVPATHAKFGLELSLLAASRLLIDGTSLLQQEKVLPPARLRHELHELHVGQEADIQSQALPPGDRNRESLELIFQGKTGALFGISFAAGLPKELRREKRDQLFLVGRDFGILFQAVDDLLEVTGNPSLVGKPVGKDREKKLTFMALHSDDPTAARRDIEVRKAKIIADIRSAFPPMGAEQMIAMVEAVTNRSR